MSSLYSLSAELVHLKEVLLASADEETGEVDEMLVKALDGVSEAFEDKALAVATVWREMATYGDNIDAEIKRLQGMKKRAERGQERLKKYLAEACERTGTERIDGVSASISFRKSEQTVVDDFDALPVEFMAVQTRYTPDKEKIKAAIKAGREVPGAHLETKNNIQIK